ncbi:MAG: hypothetical protein KDI63_12970 [Gammaproteobacteria bacterium]|nr:hypothetical protein [Gammaproteobacteria bacterium]
MDKVTKLPYHWLQATVALLIIFNAIDGAFTIFWVDSGKMREANPLMDYLINTHPVLFMSVKLLLVGLGTWLLWQFKKRPAAVISIFICFAVYFSILIYHLDVMNKVLFMGQVS